MKRQGFLLALLVAASATCSHAGSTLTTLASFNGTNGSYPRGSLTLAGSTLYGTTWFGGPSGDGEVFSVPVSGGTTPTVLAPFNGANGANPIGLTLNGATLYGAASKGGSSDGGVVFSVPVIGGPLVDLATFPLNSTPSGRVTVAYGTVYGISSNYGGPGALYELPISGGSPTVLASFGSTPNDSLVVSGNFLYGTSYYDEEGYGSGYGVVFSVPISGGTPTVLASFNGTNGSYPLGGLTLSPSGATLYGTTSSGGPLGAGEVFSLPVSGGTPTVLASFNYADGSPRAGLTLSGNTLYGTTQGEVFSVPVSGGTRTVLASFNNTNGAQPLSDLTLFGSNLYGTTSSGGAYGDGTVFSVSLNAIISLSASAPTSFGSSQGTLTITGNNGNYTAASQSFSSSPSGYVLTSAWNPTTDTEIYALKISDSVAGNLNTDLAALIAQIDGGAYSGYSVTASTTDPTSGDLTNITPGGFNLFVTITDPTLGASSDYFGFDLSPFNANSDVLTASAIAVVPEPASASLICFGIVGLLSRRRLRGTPDIKNTARTRRPIVSKR